MPIQKKSVLNLCMLSQQISSSTISLLKKCRCWFPKATMKTNKLTINYKKTNYMIVTKQKINKYLFKIKIGQNEIIQKIVLNIWA